LVLFEVVGLGPAVCGGFGGESGDAVAFSQHLLMRWGEGAVPWSSPLFCRGMPDARAVGVAAGALVGALRCHARRDCRAP
jgi:hypothetical protein